MKISKILIGLVLFMWGIPCIMAGEINEGDVSLWSSGTAYLLPKDRLEFGIFQPAAYGLSESLELSTYVLPNILMPNLSVKWKHSAIAGYDWATRHSFYYPTPLLRTVSKKGIGGLISPEFTMPHMVAFHNEILVSKRFDPRLLVTAKAGLTFAYTSEDLDERTTIDLPLIFPRLAVFYNTYNFRMGIDLQGLIVRRWHYVVDSDIFLVPKAEENFAFEHKGLIIWRKSTRFQMCLGYKLVYAEYPFGTQWHLLLPLFDFQWARQF
ncbi:hypothetical protein HQ585_20685 [candidate division KSB1 bacterium]|nr:hypothetical protein [candidate division KSB1 bacterium]